MYTGAQQKTEIDLGFNEEMEDSDGSQEQEEDIEVYYQRNRQ